MTKLIFILLLNFLAFDFAFAQSVKSDTGTHNKTLDTTALFELKKVEVPPGFPGGFQELGKIIGKNLHYPVAAKQNGTQGHVIISFIVERDGSLTDMKVKSGIGSGCDEEALRVMKLSPNWIPGKQGGRPVRVAYSVPISFTISQ